MQLLVMLETRASSNDKQIRGLSAILSELVKIYLYICISMVSRMTGTTGKTSLLGDKGCEHNNVLHVWLWNHLEIPILTGLVTLWVDRGILGNRWHYFWWHHHNNQASIVRTFHPPCYVGSSNNHKKDKIESTSFTTKLFAYISTCKLLQKL